MPTYKSSQSSESMVKSISGSYYLLFEGGGHTGNLDLHGQARFDYINSSGLAVQNTLNVTGHQAVFGNFTGFNFNHLARVVCTGDAYINRITGNLKIGGNIDLSNNLRVTGDCNITGNLYVNGVQITGNGEELSRTGFLTGDFASLYNNRGDFLVGTGAGMYGVFTTGSASSGQHLIFDPSLNIPFRWGNQTGIGNTLIHLQESYINGASVLRPSGSTTLNIGISPNGVGGVYIGGTGNSLGNRAISIGSSNGSVNADSIVLGVGHSTAAPYTTAIGAYGVASTEGEFVQSLDGFNSIAGTFQSSVYIFKAETVSDSAYTAASIPILENTTLSFRALVCAVRDNELGGAAAYSAGYEIVGCARQEDGAGGVVTIVGTPTVTTLGETEASWNVAVADNLNSLDFNVYGDAANNVRWALRIETIKIGF